MSINKENMQKYVDALRSGEYRQCWHSLKNDHGEYCALGVAGATLCEGEAYNGWAYDEIRFALGVNETFTDVIIDMNDLAESNFTEIANWIEKNYLKEAKS